MSKKAAPTMTVQGEGELGKAVEKRFSNGKQQELPNMPEGSVPQHVRERAEDVVRMSMDVEVMREELETEEEKLLDQMITHKIPVVVVVVGKSKKRIRTKAGKLKLVIEEAGIETPTKPAEKKPEAKIA